MGVDMYASTAAYGPGVLVSKGEGGPSTNGVIFSRMLMGSFSVIGVIRIVLSMVAFQGLHHDPPDP